MAGIGFEIRKILKKNTLMSLFEAYGYAGLIGSGPWLLSILALLIIGIISLGVVIPKSLIVQFLICITYMMASSLIITGGLQLMLTRLSADLFFEKKPYDVLPNLLGSQLVTTLVGFIFCLIVWPFIPLAAMTKILAIAGFICLCNQWLSVIFLSGMKEYRAIILIMFTGYSLMVLLSILLRFWGIDGLFLSFFIGEAVLLFSFMFMIVRRYPGNQLIKFDFLDKKKVFYSLFFCGLFYNLGVWVDKFIFWYYPATSVDVLGPMRSSPIYDFPIFLAYLSIVPGMAMFLVRMETDFVEHYDDFYNAVRGGSSLQEIYYMKDRMVISARRGIYDILKIQSITVVVLLLWGSQLLDLLGIDVNYQSLLNIDVVGVGVQVIMLSVFNIMYYLDKRWSVMILTGCFLLFNGCLSYLSIILGPHFYGYGFAVSTILTTAIGLIWLSKQLDDLEFTTFMREN